MMERLKSSGSETLSKLRGFLSQQALTLNGRLPPERLLSASLRVSRTELRKALAVLEAEGQIWRHVGRGTFIGARPVLNLDDVEYLSSTVSPVQIIDARLSIEPQIARLAALHGVQGDLAEMRLCNRRCREARDWRVYEAWDNKFHHAIASATKNQLLIVLYDTLNAVRRSPAWQDIRHTQRPPPDHMSFAEHDAICDAIARREADQAAESMREHIISVRNRVG
jgi:DNA-binding FadR family transcriptional regulator